MSDAPFPPHAHPFRMIDVVLELERERCTTVKSVTTDEVVRDDPAAAGGRYPLSLLAEAMAQAAVPLGGIPGGDHSQAEIEERPGRGVLAGIDRLRLLQPVRPGDRLLITATVLGRQGPLLRIRSVAERADASPEEGMVAEGEFTIVVEEGE